MDSVGTTTISGNQVSRDVIEERRRRVRHKVHTPAYASLDEATSGMVLDLSEILDISEDGMAIQTSSSLSAGQTLNLCLDLSETKTYIHTAGRVIWRDTSGRAGIQFPEMAAQSTLQLKRWLFVNAIIASMNASALPRPNVTVAERSPDLVQMPAAILSTHPTPLREPEPDAVPDHTTVLAALIAIRREVESLGSNINAALQLVAERALSLTQATGAAIALSDGGTMVCRASAGPDAPGVGVRLQTDSGFSAECVNTGRLLRCDDADTDPRVDRQSCRALGIRSMIAIPLRSGQSVSGLLELFSPDAGAFSNKDGDVMRSLADTIMAAVKRAAKAAKAAAERLQAETAGRGRFQRPYRFALCRGDHRDRCGAVVFRAALESSYRISRQSGSPSAVATGEAGISAARRQ
jgi:GAF domain-containing protein